MYDGSIEATTSCTASGHGERHKPGAAAERRLAGYGNRAAHPARTADENRSAKVAFMAVRRAAEAAAAVNR